jgi:hypothetical protein
MGVFDMDAAKRSLEGMWRAIITGTLAWIAGVFLCASAFAQKNAEEAARLEHMAAISAKYRAALPSFTCEQHVMSSKTFGGKTQTENFTATIRVVVGPTGSMVEDSRITEFAGKPVADGVQVSLPFLVDGGFRRGVPLYFARENQRCFAYRFRADRIEFKATGGLECVEPKGVKGTAYLDAAGELVRGVTERPERVALMAGLTTQTDVTYGPVVLHGETFRLPVTMRAESDMRGVKKVFAARYEGCRLYKTSVTLKPGGVVE